MLAIGGLVFLFICVFGVYAATGGNMEIVLHALPHEMATIGGAAVGTFLILMVCRFTTGLRVTREEEIEGLYAVCYQHELDHLNGVLFIDHLSRLRRDRAMTKVKKTMRQREDA